jgi:hypothetical protein
MSAHKYTGNINQNGIFKMSNIIHAAFAKHQKVPARIKREAKSLRIMLIEEAAGSLDRLTAPQIILIDRICFKYVGCRCIEQYVKKIGLIDEEKGLMRSTLDKNYLAWSNSMRLDLRELGSQRKPEDLLTPADWTEPAEEEVKK